jgi:sulfur-carrier protein adenylyltransferase/sulfurtransferase
MALPDFGAAGQERLRAATVLCLGAGGLGCPALLYLAAAGVGRLRIVDDDCVDLTNLHRQTLFTAADTGRPKAEAAVERLRAIAPDTTLEAHTVRFTAANAMELSADCAVIVDGTDNFATRYLSNDTAVLRGIPNVYGAIFRYEGQASVFAPHMDAPCYRCLFPVPPAPGTVPTCAEGGVLPVLPGLIGMIQATETIKLLTGIGQTLAGRMLHVDTRTMQFRELRLRRDPRCPACGEQRTITALHDMDFSCTLPAPEPGEPHVTALAGDAWVLDVREDWELLLTPWPHAAAHIPHSRLEQRLSEIPASVQPVAVCSIGERSAAAAALLRRNGHPAATHLRGGLRALGIE